MRIHFWQCVRTCVEERVPTIAAIVFTSFLPERRHTALRRSFCEGESGAHGEKMEMKGQDLIVKAMKWEEGEMEEGYEGE